MRSTCAQAVANSISRSLSMRVSKASRICALVRPAHGDDEGKAELLDIGVVELVKLARSASVRASRPARGLLGGRFRRQALCRAPACRQGPDGRSARRAARSSLAPRKTCAKRAVQADGAVVGGAKAHVEGALGDPGRVLEDAAVVRDEFGSRAMRLGPSARRIGVGRPPVLRDLAARRQPRPCRAFAHESMKRCSAPMRPGRPIRRQCRPMLIIFGAPRLPSS